MEDFNDNNAKLDAAIKANADAITTLGTSKANAAALGAETTARQNADAALQNNINAEAAARAAAIAAVAANLGAAGHNCRIAYGTYTGTGTYGASNPTTITCDFCPVLVLVGHASTGMMVSYSCAVFLRDKVFTTANASDTLNVSWGENSVSYYSTSKAAAQLNHTIPYYYVILGYDHTAESAT